MKKQRYINLTRAVMPCLVVFSVCSASAAMADSLAQGFYRQDSQASAIQSNMLNAKLINLGEKSHPQAVYSHAKFGKPMVRSMQPAALLVCDKVEL